MTEKERKNLKENMVKKLEQLKKSLALLEDATKPISPENSIGRVSRMDAINNKGVAEVSLRSTKKKINAIELALTKINDPEFGKCKNCKKPIQPLRLMFLPESPNCVNCAF